MFKPRIPISCAVLSSFLLTGLLSGGAPADLSRYRQFRLGTDLSVVAKEIGASPSSVNVIHLRPALIQELEWRPQPLGWSSKTEPAQEVVFSFYNGELFRIAVNYDRYEVEGMTDADMIDAISATYGLAAKPAALHSTAEGPYGDREEVVAQWQDPQYRFDLIRSPEGTTFRLIGILKNLDASAHTAAMAAKRLDEQEAPQRNADRLASEEQSAKAKLEKARLVNKPKFRP